MVAIELNQIKDQLRIEEMDGSRYFYCPLDNQLLLVTDSDGRYGLKNSCEHYQWQSTAITSFIGFSRISNFDEISKIKQKSVLNIYDFFSVYLLLSSQS